MSRATQDNDPSAFVTWEIPPEPRTSPLANLGPRPDSEAPEPIALLGRGGSGEVWRAHDPSLDREVALKILRAERAQDPGDVARFLHEARVTAGLQHPGVIPVYALGTTADGRPCFAMPEVRGRTLKQRIVEAHDPGSDPDDRWSSRRLLDAFHKVCDTLSFAHRAGVVHRDIKPQNILLGDFGEVYVADWGLARTRQGEHEGLSATPSRYAGPGGTQSGTITGTPIYMAPEQARGEDEAVGPRTDVYALGVMLYEILVGRPPFSGAVDRVLEAVMEGRRASWPAGVPDELRELAERAMALDPLRRPEDASEVAREVERWLAGDRARERALAVVAEGEQMLRDAATLRARSSAAAEQAAQLLETVPEAAPVEEKLPGWEREDEALRLEEEAGLLETGAVQKLYAALNLAPELPEAHDRLATYYRDQQAAAEARGDRPGAARAGIGLAAHDRGQHRAWRRGEGSLTLLTDPPGAEALLYRYELRARRLEPVFVRSLGRTPLRQIPLPMGSYRLTLRSPGRPDVLYPVEIGRMARWDGVAPGHETPTAVRLPDALRPDEIYVPAGWARFGGDPLSPTGFPATRLWLDAFVIARDPVTNGDYVKFLNDLVAQGREEEALRHAPRERAGHHGDAGTQILQRDPEGRFLLGLDADGDLWEPEHPVCLVGIGSAMAYADWLAGRTGRPWRLVTEFEHEKAARGVDGRSFPWGEHCDPTWTRLANSRPGDPRPARVDEFPGDVSPYGARHLAGNLIAWCEGPWLDRIPFSDGRIRRLPTPTDDHDLVVMKGGGYWHTAAGARAAQRWRSNVMARSQGVGIRLAWSLT